MNASVVNQPETLATETRKDFAIESDVILLGSARCMVIEASELRAAALQTPAALSYELEERLPLDAESMATGMTPRSRRSSQDRLIVVVDATEVQRVIDEYESQNRWVACVTAKGLLLAQGLAEEKRIADAILLCQDPDAASWDCIELRNGVPIRWRWGSESTLVEQLLLAPNESNTRPKLHALGELSESNINRLENVFEILSEPATAAIAYVERAAKRCQSGGLKPWLDLRSAQLPTKHRWRPLGLGLLCLGLAVLCLELGFLWNMTTRYMDLTERISSKDAEQQQLFRDQYPRGALPGDIPGRLRSELQKLKKSQVELSSQPPIESALPILVAFLNALPDDAKFRIDSIGSQSSQITGVDGAVRELEDRQMLVTKLRDAKFQFQEPNLTPMREGFSLKLSDLRKEKEKPVGADPKKANETAGDKR